MKFRYAVAASSLALGIAVGATAARSAIVTYTISFTDPGTYGVCGVDCGPGYENAGWEGLAEASASFNITFDPTQLYLTQSIAGIITDLTYSVTDPRFSVSPLTLNNITKFAFDGFGTLTLYSNSALEKDLAGTPNITIGVNGWAYGPGSSVWYSQDGFVDTLTTSGDVSIALSQTPLPSTWFLLLTGLAGLGLFAYRGANRNAAAIAAA